MKKTITILALIFSFCLSAQMTKQQITGKLNEIYKRYTAAIELPYEKFSQNYKLKSQTLKTKADSLAFEKKYQADYAHYLEEIQPFITKKIQELKNLAEEIRASRPFIGKKIISKQPNATTDPNTLETASTQDVMELRNEFASTFDTSYLEDNGSMRAMARFKVDSDGIIKDATAEGPNEEFNYLIIIYLYTLDKKMQLPETNGVILPQLYRFPVSINFE